MDAAGVPQELDPSEKTEMTQFVRGQWADLCARLGERVGDFIEAAWSKAAGYELRDRGPAARFVNLCCALGPGFDRKPENEWALAILADERLGQWVKVHQLVVRGASELKRRAHDGESISGQLLRSDNVLLDGLDKQRSSQGGEALAAPRLACDLEAIELRLLETEWRCEYRKVDGSWKLLPLAGALPALRIDSRDAIPRAVSVLTRPPGSRSAARLQVRNLKHSLCSQDRHPLLTYAGAHGVWSWNGHTATSTSWQVHCDAPAQAAIEPADILLGESMPQPNLLRISTCGLRDEGVPFGTFETFVHAYPADQWLFVFKRDPELQFHWPPPAGDAGVPVRTYCRVERDGAQVSSRRWVEGFHKGLDEGMRRGFDELFAAWQASTSSEASMTLAADVLVGTAEIAWGWRENLDGLAGDPLTRLLVDFDLAHRVDCTLVGEIVLGATRTRVRLIAEGATQMKHRMTRQVARGGLAEVLLPLASRWRSSFRIEFDPLAVEGGAMWSETISCSGAMAGECGLRPRLTGGGWQWYARLSCESVSAQVRVHDPLLGQTCQTVKLLPELELLNWSLG